MFHASDPETIASDSRSCEKDLEAKDRPAICGRFRLDVKDGSQLSGQNCCKLWLSQDALQNSFFSVMLEHVGTTVFSTWGNCQI